MQTEIQEHLADLSDSELINALDVAKTDLASAAAKEPNSEWHQACFAGVMTYFTETERRGLKLVTIH